MIASIRYNKNAGNTVIYSRLRNVTGQFWNFITLAWVSAEVAACRVFLLEVQDSDQAESLYVADVVLPTGGPWIIEAVLAATGAVMGGEATPAAFDSADIAAIKAKTDNLPVDPASNTQVNTRLAANAYTAPDNATIQAVRADFTAARAGKLDNLDVSVSTRAAEMTAQAALTETQSHPTLAEIEASGVLAKQATLTVIQEAQSDAATGINLLLTHVGILLDIGQGKWEIVANQMIFYKRDGSELMRLNLQNKLGIASETEIFKRIPV